MCSPSLPPSPQPWKDAAELWSMLQANAHVYICGGTAMGRDVVNALTQAVATHGGMSASAADAYVKQMTTSGRLMQELWS
jgi:sulfite reductase alpha subunit-like flavoprotein